MDTHKKPVTVTTSVLQESEQHSWMMGITLAVQLHATGGKQEVSALTSPQQCAFCRKSGNIF